MTDVAVPSQTISPPMHVAAEPLRVGLIGLNRLGWHLIERCLADGPFRVVAAYDVDPNCASSNCASAAARLNVSVVSSITELVASPNIDVAWIAHPIALRPAGLPSDLIEQLLQHNKHVVVETPLSLSTADTDRLFALAREHGRHLLVHSPRHADDDIRRAISVVNRTEFGIVRAVKWISWGYGLLPSSVQSGSSHNSPAIGSDGSEESRVVLVRQMAHALDQLVQLISHPPQRITTFGDLTRSKFADHSLDRDRNTSAIAAWIEFTNGAHAEIDIRLDSPAALQTGWVIQSARGGYADGRQYSLTEDGEVFDSLASPLNFSTGILDDLNRSLRANVIDDFANIQTRATVRLLEAIFTAVVDLLIEVRR